LAGNPGHDSAAPKLRERPVELGVANVEAIDEEAIDVEAANHG
jgi:hypothetical protein